MMGNWTNATDYHWAAFMMFIPNNIDSEIFIL